jgi:hypothetical protein
MFGLLAAVALQVAQPTAPKTWPTREGAVILKGFRFLSQSLTERRVGRSRRRVCCSRGQAIDVARLAPSSIPGSTRLESIGASSRSVLAAIVTGLLIDPGWRASHGQVPTR